MPNLNEKSKFNIDAAIMLIDKSLYAPSVHCSYYAIVQISTNRLSKYLNKSYEELKKMVDASDSGTHVFLLNQLYKLIENKKSTVEAEKISRSIKALKGLRIESDYYNKQIDHPTSNKALNLSRDIIKEINNTLP